MLAQYKFPHSESVLLNLTETLLGPNLDNQAIYSRNIGIERRLSNLSVLCVNEKINNKSRKKEKVTAIPKRCMDKVIFGSIGDCTVAILPQKISSMLKKGWSYQYRLTLLWETFRKLNLSNTGVVCLPESNLLHTNKPSPQKTFDLHDLLRPLGHFTTNLDTNLVLCNPSYYAGLIVEEGLTQEEFAYMELYMRCGGNIILSAEHVVFDRELVDRHSVDGDQICLNF